MITRTHSAMLGVLFVAACSASSTPAAPANAPAAGQTMAPVAAPAPSAADPKAALSGALLVLDVRTPEEHAQGHLAHDVLIPVGELESRLAEVEAAVKGDKSAKIVTYCRAGRRAEQAKEVLAAHGFSNVVNGGGYEQLR